MNNSDEARGTVPPFLLAYYTSAMERAMDLEDDQERHRAFVTVSTDVVDVAKEVKRRMGVLGDQVDAWESVRADVEAGRWKWGRR